MSLLELKNISTGYDKKQVLFDISLEIEKGETILLVGSNGSGKSTLLKAVYGILPSWKTEKETGSIIYNGENITGFSPHSLIDKGIMYIPQKNELFEDMNVEENLLMSTLHLNDRKESKKRVEEVFEKMPVLKQKRKQVISQLSGGERKIVPLGMVLMNKPNLLLYDEPLAGLSGQNAEMVLQWLSIVKANGTTMVIVEHRVRELIELATKVVGMKLGHLYTKNFNNIDEIKRFMV